MVEAMNGSPRFPWLRAYTDAAISSWLALRGALSPSGGRCVAALQAASSREIRAGLQATSMLETSLGGVSALLGDLQASGVAVESGSRAQLLSSALLEGRLQQQLVVSLWLPLLSPHGDALLAALGPAFSFRFAPTPPASEFGGAWCFDWRPDDTHPALRKWLRHRATLDSRFAEGATGAALCPVDGGLANPTLTPTPTPTPTLTLARCGPLPRRWRRIRARGDASRAAARRRSRGDEIGLARLERVTLDRGRRGAARAAAARAARAAAAAAAARAAGAHRALRDRRRRRREATGPRR